MKCIDCGRTLKRAAFTLPAREGVHNGGSLGPTCARKRGLIEPRRRPLFTVARRARKPAASPQMAMEFA